MKLKSRLAIGAVLLGLMPFAHGEPVQGSQADPRAREFLRKVLELARLPDLSDVAVIEKTMGFRLKPLSEETADLEKMPRAVWRKNTFYLVEEATFPLPKSARVELASRGDKLSHARLLTSHSGEVSVNMTLFLTHEEGGACLTESDMVETFGPKPRAEILYTYGSRTSYKYEFAAGTRTSVLVLFPHHKPCIEQVGFLRNFPLPRK